MWCKKTPARRINCPLGWQEEWASVQIRFHHWIVSRSVLGRLTPEILCYPEVEEFFGPPGASAWHIFSFLLRDLSSTDLSVVKYPIPPLYHSTSTHSVRSHRFRNLSSFLIHLTTVRRWGWISLSTTRSQGTSHEAATPSPAKAQNAHRILKGTDSTSVKQDGSCLRLWRDWRVKERSPWPDCFSLAKIIVQRYTKVMLEIKLSSQPSPPCLVSPN
jgi:hypothetical protein